MSRHRPALRKYLLGVTSDLVSRGVLRRAAGQSLADLLLAEGVTVLHELHEDLVAIGLEAVTEVKTGAASALGAFVGAFVGGLGGKR